MKRIVRGIFAPMVVVGLGFGLSGCSTEEPAPVVEDGAMKGGMEGDAMKGGAMESGAMKGGAMEGGAPKDAMTGNDEKGEMAADKAEYKTSGEETPK